MRYEGSKYISLEESFWSKVCILDNSDCWNWIMSKDREGYGRFVFRKVEYRSHRISWYLFNGSLPDNKLVLHKCDNKSCVNPNHLYCGTHQDNKFDRESRNPVPADKYASNKSKLYSGEVWLIRKIFNSSIKVSQLYVSKMFNISQPTVSLVLKSKYFCKENYYV